VQVLVVDKLSGNLGHSRQAQKQHARHMSCVVISLCNTSRSCNDSSSQQCLNNLLPSCNQLTIIFRVKARM
jgi:hypothetical protein